MSKTKYLNEEPFKEKVCPTCGKMLRETRVRIGKGLKCYRIWVHKETRKRDCYEVDTSNMTLQEIMSNGHKPICQCGECNIRRKMTGT